MSDVSIQVVRLKPGTIIHAVVDGRHVMAAIQEVRVKPHRPILHDVTEDGDCVYADGGATIQVTLETIALEAGDQEIGLSGRELPEHLRRTPNEEEASRMHQRSRDALRRGMNRLSEAEDG